MFRRRCRRHYAALPLLPCYSYCCFFIERLLGLHDFDAFDVRWIRRCRQRLLIFHCACFTPLFYAILRAARVMPRRRQRAGAMLRDCRY